MNARLQVWAVARGDSILYVSVLCEDHATWTSDCDFVLPRGLRAVRVKARAWLRRLERGGSGCVECAARAGKVLKVTDAGPLGSVRVGELTISGGEA